MFTQICVDELLVAAAKGAVTVAVGLALAPIMAPLAGVGLVGAFFAGASEGALANSAGTIVGNLLSGQAWSVGLRESYIEGWFGGGLVMGVGRLLKGWWQAGRAGGANRILRSASEGKELPPTGVTIFDELVVGTTKYARWKANLQRRGFEVIEKSLREGVAAEILDGKVTVDPQRFRYIDLLHESRHIRQLEKLGAQGLALSVKVTSWFERGAYEYERRLGQGAGFSEEYLQFIDKRINDYWSRSLRQKYMKSDTTRAFLNSIWK